MAASTTIAMGAEQFELLLARIAPPPPPPPPPSGLGNPGMCVGMEHNSRRARGASAGCVPINSGSIHTTTPTHNRPPLTKKHEPPAPPAAARPGPLGLGGFALTTFVLSVYHTGVILEEELVGCVNTKLGRTRRAGAAGQKRDIRPWSPNDPEGVS
jgi:hypothetical protein